MRQFLVIAAAHFLALLSPGPDFFLIARTSLSSGWRVASGVCAGVAAANGIFIGVAFAGLGVLRPDSGPFMVLQIGGCAYLLYLGVQFLRHAGGSTLVASATGRPGCRPARPFVAWCRSAGMGLLSGLLNPKNALFYASLAAMLTGPQAGAGWKAFYGAWMVCVVLLWDLLVAVMIGNRAVLRRFARMLPWLERACGLVLVLVAVGVALFLLLRQ